GLLIFVGFETAANLAEETSQPKRQIPRAVLLSVAIVSVFYLIGSYTQVAGFHFSLETFSTPDVFLAPVFALGGQYSSTGTVRLLELIVLLDMMAVGIGGAFALVVVYLMMSVGALLGLRDHPNRVGLWIAALLGIAVTGGAVYGAFYQVKSPTLLAPMYAAVLFAIGLVAALLFKGRQPAR